MARGGGAEGDRTPDLRIANATLSQLSYGPIASMDPLRGAAGTMVIESPPVKEASRRQRANLADTGG